MKGSNTKSMVDISMSSIGKNNMSTIEPSSTSIMLPPLSQHTYESITKNMKAFSIPKGNRDARARTLNKDQVLSEYYGCDSPPHSKYNPELRESIKGAAITSEKRFTEPTTIKLIKANVPCGYLNNFDTFKKSLNQSESNLSKADRFNHRIVYENDLRTLPSPWSYNLSSFNSISHNTTLDREGQAKIRFSPKKQRYDRFKAGTYFKEMDRGQGDNSPGPWAYSSIEINKFPSVRKSSQNLFGTADRGLLTTKKNKKVYL